VDDRSSRNSRLGGFHVASPRGRFWGWASWAAEGANHQSFAENNPFFGPALLFLQFVVGPGSVDSMEFFFLQNLK
jgi:hypothetical protein